jgi:hypothetical protein
MSYDLFKWIGCCTTAGGPIEIVYINGSYKTKYISPEAIRVKYIEPATNKVLYIQPEAIRVRYIEPAKNKVKYIEPPIIKVKLKC